MKLRLDNFRFTARPKKKLGNAQTKFLEAAYNNTLTNTIVNNTFTNVSLNIMRTNGFILKPPGIQGVFVVPKTALYSVDATHMFNAFVPTNDVCMIDFYVNGTFRKRLARDIYDGINQFPHSAGSCTLPLEEGDEIELRAFQNSGTSKTTYNAASVTTNRLYTRMDVFEIGEWDG